MEDDRDVGNVDKEFDVTGKMCFAGRILNIRLTRHY